MLVGDTPPAQAEPLVEALRPEGIPGRSTLEHVLLEGVARIMFSAAVMGAVIWLLLAGQPLGGLVLVPAAAVLLRRSAESGRMRQLAHRLVPHR